MSTANNPNSSNNDVVVTKSGGAGGGDPSVNIPGRGQHASGKAVQSATPAKVVAGLGDVAGLGAPNEAALLLPKNGETPTRIARRKKKEDEDQQADRSADSAGTESGEGVGPTATLSDDALLLAQADTGGGAGAAAGGDATTSSTGSAAGTGAAAGTEATAATATAAAGMSTAGMLALAAVAVGVAAAGGGGGGGGGTSPPAAPAPDTTAPVILSMSSVGNTVVLNYNEALDAVNVPAPGGFVVTVNGVPNVVTGVAVAGVGNKVVTLTLTAPVATGANVVVTYTDPTGANDVAAIQDAAGNDAVSFSTGVVADGYVRGAQIYIDTNNNGVADASEALAGVVTDANGNFILPAGTPAGSMMATGGVNIDTGVPNAMVFKAPAGSTVVSPLTTLVQALIAKNPGTSVANATAAVVTSLGLPGGTDLTNYDPIAALAANGADPTALAVQKAAVQVATLVDLATDAPATGSTTTQVATTVINNLATQIGNPTAPTVISLIDVAVITAALGTVSTADPAAINAQLTTINDATTLTQMTTAQAVALDTTAPAAPTAITLGTVSDTGTTGDNMTNDSMPVVRVNFNGTATDGTAANVGNVVTVYEGATEVGNATLVTADITNGYVDVTLTLAGEGSHTLTAKLADVVHTSVTSTAYTLTLDTTAPSAPTFAEQGSTDTANAWMNAAEATTTTFRVTLPTTGSLAVAGDQVQLLGGATTKTATLTSANITNGYVDITLAAADLGSDGAKSLTAQVIDAAGNTSAASTAITFTLDTTIATPTAGLTTDSGNGSDLISINAALTFSSAVADVTRSFTVDGGTASGTYTAPTADGAHTVVVTDTDTAGNTATASLTFTLDAAAPTLASSTPADNADAVVGSSIVLTFNESVAAGTGNIVISDGTNTLNIPVGSSAVVISGNTITITPNPAPSPATAYTVTIASGVITDIAGNAFAGIASGDLNFTMADLPIVTITSDETDNLLNVGDTSTLTFTLSAASTDFAVGDVTVAGGTLSNFAGSGTSYTATLTPTANSTTNVTVSVGASAFTSNSLGNLASSTLTIPVDTLAPVAPTVALTTNSGSTSDSISNVGTLNVTGTETGATVQYSTDGTTWLTSFTAAEGANTVQVRQKDAALNASSATTFTFTLDTTIATPTASLTTNSGSTSDSITNSAALTFSTAASDVTRTYTVDSVTASTYTAPTSAGQHTVVVTDTDTAGNTASSTPLTFTLDTTAPTLSSASPTDGAPGVSPAANIVLTFSEAVAAGSGNIVISDGTNSTTIAVTDAQVSFGTDTITINPTSNLALGTAHTVTIGSGVITDTAGNAFAGISSGGLDFTTATAPSLSTTLGGVTNLDPRSSLVLSVSEDVKWAQGTHTITITNDANDTSKAGFRTESTANTQTISVTADANGTVTSITGGAVAFDNTNNKIVIDPTFDLDISNNYSLAVSTGAFLGLDSGQASVAFTTVNFSTVTPGLLSGGESAAAQAQTMNATTGEMGASLRWLDVTNPADDEPSGGVYQPFDTINFDFSFVVKDMDTVATDVTVTDTYIQFNNFGANDLIYIDNQLNQATAQQSLMANAFSGGVGTSADPFSITMNGTSLASSFNVVVVTTITLPSLSDALLGTINSNSWSNTGIMITG